MYRKIKLYLFFLIILQNLNIVKCQQKSGFLDAKFGFLHPQDSARTKVWWFHGETETTKEGITADLTAFKTVGVGGVVYYDQSHGKAEKALKGFSTEWWDMLKFSASEAKRLGLTFELHISNGYVAGGTWITNKTGMKRLTATEILIRGGKYFSKKLPEPKNKYNYYKDVAILAFPAQQGAGKTSYSESVKISSNFKQSEIQKLFDIQSGTAVRIPRNDSGVYINLEFSKDFEARSITYKMQPRGKSTTSATNVPAPPSETFTGTGYRVLPDFGQLEVSYDGIHYQKVCDLKPIYKVHESWRQKTVSFASVKAKYYRLNFHDWWENSEKNQELLLNSIVLNSSAMLDQFEEKAGLFTEYIEKDRTPLFKGKEVIQSEKILNITDKLDSNGTLHWNAPKGDWVVMRFAYEPTGANTKHGRANLIGRECDKLSVEAAELHWNNYVAVIADSLKASNSGDLKGIAMDSHEAGSQNWTDKFIDQFKVRRGYDPTPYLPAMMGYIVNGVKESEGFLFDVRRNIADMISDNYYGTFNRMAKQRGLDFTAQAIGNALCIVGDPIQAKSKVDKPQGEFWVIHPNGNYDIKESSSAAHLYNKSIASAEAFTDTQYSTSLSDLKSLADYAYAFGINEFVICASAYQPWLDKIPGSTGGGRQYAINRNNTWWNYSRPFWDYQARSAYLMRMGKSVADISVYLGENAPVKILTNRLPDIPGGYDFDAFSTDALLTRMDGKDGKIVLPDGISYKIMILPKNGDITLIALRKIEQIVEKGAIIYGSKPIKSESATDIGKEKEYQNIADRLWGKNPAKIGTKETGRGKVYWGGTLENAFEAAQINPDIMIDRSDPKKSKIYFAHRKLKDSDIYFIDNHKDTSENNLFSFSASGRFAQIWNPVSGERFSVPFIKSTDGKSALKISLVAHESCFVIISDFEEKLPLSQERNSYQKMNVNEDWQVYFNEKTGGVGNTIFHKLQDWTEFTNPQIKYYSGTAIYKKSIKINSKRKNVILDIGNPNFAAHIFINGKDAGIIWCSPWQLDITSFLKDGNNELEIHVANPLTNRMIYDSQLPEKQRVTYSYPEIVTAADSLEPSGLTTVKILQSEY
ncbi:glycosyl hydrolase [Chryseobacterium tongliaoense]|uniref:glycosyl hydrolase n=1 Tax=Chryseobacterium tongliaoense TaxID=3240933 RepID=UPI003517C163